MPPRISIAGALVLAACLVVPVSIKAVATASAGQPGGTVEEADPPEPYPSTMPMTAAPLSADSVMGKATINAAGYAPDSFSWPILVGLIVLGFLPSVIIILRSSHRRRAGPIEPLS